MKMKSKPLYIYWMMLALITLCFGSCKDDDNSVVEYDPSKPVVISEFSPEGGGIGTRLLVKGENFGTDASKIKVTIGGESAPVISSDGTTIYCMVPFKAYEGSIEVEIADEMTATAPKKFIYEKKLLVTTLLGKTDEKGDYLVTDGPFDNCGGIDRCGWFSFDPKNPQHLYFTADGRAFRKVDFEQKMLTTQFGNGNQGMDRMRTITWMLDGDNMIIATDRGGDADQSNSVLTRAQDFKDVNVLTKSKQCNGSAIHPVNGELYFNSYGSGEVFRYQIGSPPEARDQLFTIQDSGWEFNIQIHPSGNYAYIVVINKHYILRTDYDWAKKTFTIPYIVCGKVDTGGWVDGVGTNARLSNPYQGAFVKNPEYAGGNDEYDFYFADRGNQCIRVLTPTGRVNTFAGRGSLGVNTDAHGYIDGDLRLEARFHNPEALIYDEASKTFYVGDSDNHRIRKIALEE